MWLLTQLFEIVLALFCFHVLWRIVKAPFVWYWNRKYGVKKDEGVDYAALYEDYRRRYKAGLPVPTAAAERFALDP